MTKRPADKTEDSSLAYLKRQKLTNTAKPAVSIEEIYSGSQLKKLLAFDQDNSHSKYGIQAFKGFLDSFAAVDADNTQRTAILKEYFETQRAALGDEEKEIFLPDLMQTWSFASQSNGESLLSAVPAVLALLLRTISTIHELAEYGLRVGRTLLQKRQQELIARGITANKSKEFVIAPALRLLRELTVFDCGALAKQVFRHRDQLFKSFSRNLNLRYGGEGVEDWRKPSVRTNALRLFLGLIKFLPGDAKQEFLNQRDIVSAVTRDIKDDPPYIIREVIEVLKINVLQDETLPRDAKTKVVNATSLRRLVMLYRYEQAGDETSSSGIAVDTIAHEFLMLACISPDMGVLNRQGGFYPRGVNPDENHDADAAHDPIDLGLDSVEWIDKFTMKIPVRNTILADFIQTLRPWSSLKQSELLLSILKAAPELIAEYFYGKRSFGFEPKLTATWIGYAAFIFSALQIPIPPYFGHQERYARLPPPTAVVIENLLPQPLCPKVLTRCMNQAHSLIAFCAVRLLCIAFDKLKEVLKMYREAAATSSSVWTAAAERITEEFYQRCPSIKDVINNYRNIPATDLFQRQTITKLLVLYYEVIPHIALDAKFDVSGALTQTLKALGETAPAVEDRAMRAMELDNLFQFAHFSPGMRWFTRAEGASLSPFAAMLKLYATAPSDLPLAKLRTVLESVVGENQILQRRTGVSALDTLVLSLKSIQGSRNEDAIYEFLDGCVARCASKSVKYLFMLEEICAETHGSDETQSPVSLLTLAILEQWPFILKSAEDSTLQDVVQFVARLLTASMKAGEDEKVLKSVTQRLIAATPESPKLKKVLARTRQLVVDVAVPDSKPYLASIVQQTKENMPTSSEKHHILATMLNGSGRDPEDNSALTKWTTREVDEVIEGGSLAALIRLLSSSHLSIRKEAATNIAKFAAKLRESSFGEKEQIWLLLSEVVETSRPVIDKEPLPNILSSFAAHSIAVLEDPLDALYPKVNKFLSQGPVWDLGKIPLLYKIFDEAPSSDDAHYLEIGWLLSCMLDGLQTSGDMSIYRTRRVFEKLLSFWNNTYLSGDLRDKILRILFRATTIEGGSTTLITRFSGLTWLDAQIALTGGVPLQVLMERIRKSCDQKRVETWSKGDIKFSQDAQAVA